MISSLVQTFISQTLRMICVKLLGKFEITHYYLLNVEHQTRFQNFFIIYLVLKSCRKWAFFVTFTQTILPTQATDYFKFHLFLRDVQLGFCSTMVRLFCRIQKCVFPICKASFALEKLLGSKLVDLRQHFYHISFFIFMRREDWGQFLLVLVGILMVSPSLTGTIQHTSMAAEVSQKIRDKCESLNCCGH